MSLLEDITRRVEETGKQLTRQMEELNALGNAEKTTHELRKALEQSAGSLSAAVHEISGILSKTEEHMAGIREETRRSREELQKIGKGTESEVSKAVRQVEATLGNVTQEVGNAVQQLLETEPALVAKSLSDLLNSVEEVKRREEENQKGTNDLVTAIQGLLTEGEKQRRAIDSLRGANVELLGGIKRNGEHLVGTAKTVEQLEKQMKNFESDLLNSVEEVKRREEENQKGTNDLVTAIQGLLTEGEKQRRAIDSLRGANVELLGGIKRNGEHLVGTAKTVEQLEKQMKSFEAEMRQQIGVVMEQTEGGWKRWLRW